MPPPPKFLNLSSHLKKQFIIILTLFVCCSCYGQKNIFRISDWKGYSLPLNSDSLHNYQFDMQGEWTVFKKNNDILATKTRIKISDTLPFKIIPSKNDKYKLGGKRSVIQVVDGYLVGFYRGEWGGNLYWFSKDGKRKYEISEHEIVQFIKRDNKIYAIEGLAHLSMSQGSIIQIMKVNKKWATVNYLKLPSAPDGVDLASNNNFVIITSESLLTVDTNLKIDTLIEEGFWRAGLYPTSLVIKDNIAYMGMRKGVYKFDLSNNTQEWLMKY